MANYAVETYVTPLGTHSEVEALLETFLEAQDSANTILLVGINPVSRDRDRCVGYVMCLANVIAESAYHLLVDEGPLTITTNP